MKNLIPWKRILSCGLICVTLGLGAACTADTDSNSEETLKTQPRTTRTADHGEGFTTETAGQTSGRDATETNSEVITTRHRPTRRTVNRVEQPTTTAEAFVAENEREKKEPGLTMTSNLTGKQYTLVWMDDFEGSKLNTNNWTVKDTAGITEGALSYQASGNVSVGNGRLTLTARKESAQGKEYTGAFLSTQGKQSFQYGRIEFYAQTPRGNGISAVFRTMGNLRSWPFCGSIEIMKFLGSTDETGSNINGDCAYTSGLYWVDRNGDGQDIWSVDFGGYRTPLSIDPTASKNPEKLGNKFHVYGIEWTRERIFAYFDYQLTGSVAIQDSSMELTFHQLHYLALSMTVGGQAGKPNEGTSFPQRLVVDWVKVWV